MKTINIIHDVNNPKLHTVYAPENTQFCLKIKFEGAEFENYDEKNPTRFLFLKGGYVPAVEYNEDGTKFRWDNYPLKGKDGEPDLTVVDDTLLSKRFSDDDNLVMDKPNELTVICEPNEGKKSVDLLYTLQDVEYTDVRDEFGEFELKPSIYGNLHVDINYQGVNDNPVNGAIEISGVYEDGTEFSYLLNGYDNKAQ